jgi:hypothetical protein
MKLSGSRVNIFGVPFLWVIEGAVKAAGYEIPKFSRKHPK